MDLRLYFRVLWRFRLLVGLGLLLALALGFLSYFRLTFDGGAPTVTYRETEVWQSGASLLVTESGFPEGYRSPQTEFTPVSPKKAKPAPTATTPEVPRFGDPSRFNALAALYANFVPTAPVRRIMKRGGPINGSASAVVRAGRAEGLLPIIDVTGVSTTPQAALSVATRAVKALREYIELEQARNNIPARQRVIIEQITNPTAPELAQGRKLTRPVFVFVAVLIAVMGLAFILENLRPRARVVTTTEGEDFVRRIESRSRRSA